MLPRRVCQRIAGCWPRSQRKMPLSNRRAMDLRVDLITFGTFPAFTRLSPRIDSGTTLGEHPVLGIAGVNDAPGGESAGCRTDLFIVWSLRPRRKQMPYAKCCQVRFGVARREAAASLPSRPTVTRCHQGREASSSPRRWARRPEVALHSRRAGIVGHLELQSDKRMASIMQLSLRPSATCSHDLSRG